MAVETPEPQSSSWLCPQIQPWQKEVSYSWRDAGLYEHSFSLQSYGTSSVAMGNGTYFRWSYGVQTVFYFTVYNISLWIAVWRRMGTGKLYRKEGLVDELEMVSKLGKEWKWIPVYKKQLSASEEKPVLMHLE